MDAHNFFAELKRRKVFKVAVAYAVVSWLLIQIATQVFPFFEIPNWAVRLVVLLLILGFPVALILAWAFEITPEGIKLEKDVSPNESMKPRTGRKLVGITIALAVIAAGLFAFQLLRQKMPMTSAPAVTPPERSIAVLPFENLSDDKANAYFASGIQDEILTKLAAIPDVKVISRVSTEKYRSHPEDVKKVASELGVATILEGSVQKSGDNAHINVQLIDARSDSHLWAQTYDRDLKNIFAVEGEVAEQVAAALKLKLLASSAAELQAPPTKDAAAYDLFLRAGYVHRQWFRGTGNIDEAFNYLRAAIARDPNFAMAYASLAIFETQKASRTVTSGPRDAALEIDARANAEKALALQPNLPAAKTALGLIALHLDGDYSKAIEFLKVEPNRTAIPLALAQARLGQWSKATETMQHFIELDPRNAHGLQIMATYYGATRRYSEAADTLDRAIAVDPNDWSCVVGKAELLLVQGQLDAARNVLQAIPNEVSRKLSDVRYLRWRVEFVARAYPAAFQVAQDLAAVESDQAAIGLPEVMLAASELPLGKDAEARRQLDDARAKVEALLSVHADDVGLHSRLARIYALQGDKQRALDEAEKTVALSPISKDAERGLDAIETLAEVHAHFGDTDQALQLIRQLLNADGAGLLLTPALLKLDPVWDPIRNDPRFQKLLTLKEHVGP
jgi:TolB-like protein